MTTPSYSELQRKYWVMRPANIIQFMTVEFQHPDFGFIRLVANQFSDRQFDVDGTMETFRAAAMTLPKVTNQTTNSTRAGTITFGRIGLEFRRTLLMITPLGSISSPITVKLRQYQQGITQPVYERRLFVDKDGISIGAENVSVRLSVDNPAKLSESFQFYDPQIWKGLQSI